MARKSTHKTTQKRFSKFNFTLSNSQRLVMGSFLVISGILLFIALLSYFFTGESDQTVLAISQTDPLTLTTGLVKWALGLAIY